MSSFFRTALVLGLLSAVGPFAIDMYLPAMPAIGTDLGASVGGVQATLTLYFVAFGLSQMFYGPLADQVGRKPPILLGLGLFLIGSLICAFAPTIGWLIAGRVVQALGAAAVMVVPRAIIRDMMTGAAAARLMAAIMMVISVSPMLAPLAGAGFLALGSWRLIFWALAGVSLVSLAITLFAQAETLKPADRVRVNFPSMGRGIRVLMTDPAFLGLTFVGAFGFASFFVFISSAAFVYSDQFGLTPVQFGLAFAVNAMGFIGASQFAGIIGGRIGMGPMIRLAAIVFAAATCLLLLLALAGMAGLWTIIVLLVVGNAGLGLIIPATMVMALDDHGDIAGLASSLGGTLQMLTGGLFVALTGPFFDDTALPMIAAIALAALITLGLASWVLPRLKPAAEQQA